MAQLGDGVRGDISPLSVDVPHAPPVM